MVTWSTDLPPSHVVGDTQPIAPDYNKLLANVNEIRGAISTVGVSGLASDLQGTVVGYPQLVINPGTANYTLALGDVGDVVELTSSSAVTVTVPSNATAAIPVGSVIEIVRMGSGTVTVSAAAGVTLQSPVVSTTARTQYSTIRLRKRATNTWIVAGDLTPDTSSSGGGGTVTPLLTDAFSTGTTWDSSKWTTGGNFTFSVVSGAGRMTSVNSTGWNGKATAKIANTANVGVLLRARFDAHNHVIRIYFRATGSLGSYAENNQDFTGLAAFYDHSNKTYGVQQYANGAASTPSGATTLSRTLNPNSWYWWRIEAVGTSVRIRSWVDGASEPTTWDVSGLTSTTQAGAVTLTDAMYDTQDGWVIDWDDVSIYTAS